MNRIDLKPAVGRRARYGIVYESTTVHPVTGRGVHNPAHHHRLDVWVNPHAGPGEYLDPDGNLTDQPMTMCLTAVASVISAPRVGDEVVRGPSLAVGETVEVSVGGEFKIGNFTVTAGNLRDPFLVRAEPVPAGAL